MLLYREKIIYHDIYTNIIDKFDVISWLSTLCMFHGVNQGHLFFYTKTGIYLLSQCRKVLVICTFGYVQLCFDSC